VTRRSAACHPVGVAALFHLLVRCALSTASTVVAMPTQSVCAASIIETPTLVAFEGCIDQQSARLLVRALERRPSSPLLVKSSGGDASAAIEAAAVMALLQTRLIIRGQCLSSCANYWLPAAASVLAEQGSVIGFHGDVRTISRHDPLPPFFGLDARQGLAWLVEQEAELGKAIPKVEDLHALQAIRRGGDSLRIHLRGSWQSCPGLQLPTVWAPTLARLQALGIVSRIIPHDPAFEPRITAGHDAHPMSAANDESDAAARCVCTDAP